MRSIAVPLIATLCAACGSRAVPAPPDPAPVPASAPATRPYPPPPAEVCRCIRICVVQRGRLLEVPVRYNTRTGDTLTMDSLPFSHVYPVTGEYAAVAGWFIHNEPITFHGVRWIRYGMPRVLGIPEITRIGEHRGVGVYLEMGQTVPVDVIYLPTRPGCEFQPYVRSAKME
ncbi:MAG TPA: hypothetical protein VFR37_14140 [Longimicrobium sp.]|nr:hypothetical protein [Longimicrobium sp.]